MNTHLTFFTLPAGPILLFLLLYPFQTEISESESTMFSQAIVVSALALLAEARFGQEQIPVAAVQAVTS